MRCHDIEGVIGLEVEQIQHLFKHALMLTGDAYLRMNAWFRSEGFD